jgi:hypothetical protein
VDEILGRQRSGHDGFTRGFRNTVTPGRRIGQVRDKGQAGEGDQYKSRFAFRAHHVVFCLLVGQSGRYRWSDFWMIGLFAGSSHLSFLK